MISRTASPHRPSPSLATVGASGRRGRYAVMTLIVALAVAAPSCGSSRRSAASPPLSSTTVTTTDPFVASVSSALSGGSGSVGYDDSCNNNQVNAVYCRGWAFRDAEWASQAAGKVGALQAPAQYRTATQQLAKALYDESTADNALAAACATAPAGATRQNDSNLDTAVSRVGEVYSAELLVAVRPFDPYFGVLR